MLRSVVRSGDHFRPDALRWRSRKHTRTSKNRWTATTDQRPAAASHLLHKMSESDHPSDITTTTAESGVLTESNPADSPTTPKAPAAPNSASGFLDVSVFESLMGRQFEDSLSSWIRGPSRLSRRLSMRTTNITTPRLTSCLPSSVSRHCLILGLSS